MSSTATASKATSKSKTPQKAIIPPRPAGTRWFGPKNGPRIFAWDIETAPGLALFWSPRTDYISPAMTVKDPGDLMCWAGRWVGEKTRTFFSSTQDTEEEMLARLWWCLDSADYLLSWNGKSFDSKRVRTEFVKRNWAPPSPAIELDLMATVKREFSFASNKLDEVAKRLVGQEKVKHEGIGLWLGCMEGDKRAWSKMRKYNVQDVDLLEVLFDYLRPWLRRSIYFHGDACPICDGTDLQERGQVLRGAGVTHQRYSCNECGSLMYAPLRIGSPMRTL